MPGYRSAGYTEMMVSPTIFPGNVVFSGLYRYDARFGAIPDLADGPCVPQGDGTVIRCRIVETTFQDGTPLTGDDVAYSYHLVMRKTWPVGGMAGSLEEVRVVDARTVDFVLPAVDPTFLTLVLPAVAILPRHVVEAAYADFVAATAGQTAAGLTKLADAIDDEVARDPPVCTPRLDAVAALLDRIGVRLYREDHTDGQTGMFDPCGYLQAASPLIRAAGRALGSTGSDAVAAAFVCFTTAWDPVGTGPYRLVSATVDRVHLEAWPGYHGGLAATRFLDFVPATDDGSSVVAGAVDIQQAVIPSSDFFADAAAHAVQVNPPTGRLFVELAFNVRPGRLFADLALRRALQLCVDLPRDVDAVAGGVAIPAYSPILPGSWAYDENLPKPVRDIAAARRLIESAGWTVDADGTYAKDGTRLAAEIVVRGDDADRLHMADLIGLQAHDCGMDIRSHPATPSEIFDPHGLLWYPHDIPGTTTPFDLYIGGYGYVFGSDPGSTFGSFVSSLATDAEHPDSSTRMNWTGFADPVLDRLIEAAASTYDQAERARLYRQAQQELAAQLPHLFLWVAPTFLDAARAAVATTDGILDMSMPNWAWRPERLVVTEGVQ